MPIRQGDILAQPRFTWLLIGAQDIAETALLIVDANDCQLLASYDARIGAGDVELQNSSLTRSSVVSAVSEADEAYPSIEGRLV
ncbi:hypothetical protein L6654_39510 [Bradyrhizobium sp. WYCCWR 13023]|uniref:Uncharacterized protein n=1 Tax=Bradyrhizobium zhengyangense TaxID=2911009 RepID=A0A9X1RE78_9BRAD|nr:hypothetical protein [Bradyrhizobium zhengyangense]MCG2632692.1 hypothetical protein [Bradyrhizobium zhengyangense]